MQPLILEGKKKEKERKENEKDVLSPSVETGEETSDQHGVPYLQCCAFPLLSKPRGAGAVCLSIRAMHGLSGWKGSAPPEWLRSGSSVTKLPRRRGKANMLQQAGKL